MNCNPPVVAAGALVPIAIIAAGSSCAAISVSASTTASSSCTTSCRIRLLLQLAKRQLLGRLRILHEFAVLLLADVIVLVRREVPPNLGQGIRHPSVRLGGRSNGGHLDVQRKIQVGVLRVRGVAQLLLTCAILH